MTWVEWVLAVSVGTQACAAGVLVLTMRQGPRVWLALLTAAFTAMAARRAIALHAALALGRPPNGASEMVALAIAGLMLTAALHIHRRQAEIGAVVAGTAMGSGAKRARERLAVFGVGLGLLSTAGILGMGHQARVTSEALYVELRDSMYLQVARGLAARADAEHDDAKRIARLSDAWADMQSAHPGAYLCMIQGGKLSLHTSRPAAVGLAVGAMQVGAQDGTTFTLSDLADRRADWVGPFTTRSGEEQLVAFAYSKLLDGLVAVHIPAATAEAGLAAARRPWMFGMVMVALIVLPLALLLFYLSFVAAQRAVVESEQRLRTVMTANPDLAFVLDRNGKLVEVYGDSMPEVPDLATDKDLTSVVGPQTQSVIAELARLAADGHGERRTECQMRFGERQGSYSLVFSPITLDGARCALVVARDVTREHSLETQKRKLEQQLVQSQKLETLGTLAGGIAHDFNNVLSPILTCTEIALEDLKTGQPQRRDLEIVLRAGHRAAELVRQLLTFSRNRDVDIEVIDAADAVRNTRALLQATVPSTCDINTPTEPHWVLGNAGQLEQIVMNLVINSVHALPDHQGNISVRVEPVRVDNPPGQVAGETDPHAVAIVVHDDGVGMDENVRQRIFDPFFSTKPTGQGTGLGMSVVHGIVAGHAGHIEVDSAPGKGTTVTLTLPTVAGDGKKTAPRSDAPIAGTECILVVDDEALIAQALTRALSRLGYRCVPATSPAQALEVFAKGPDSFDLALLDLTMPVRTGLELAQDLRAIRPDIPIVLMTGAEPPSLSGDIPETVDAVLTKPLEIAALTNLIRKHAADVGSNIHLPSAAERSLSHPQG